MKKEIQALDQGPDRRERMVVSGGNDGKQRQKKGRTLIVGVKLAMASREVLTWALLKEARPGDRLIALHVLPVAATPSQEQVSRTFDALISVYHGFCNLKQVELQVKISFGQLRKVLLEETKLFQASKLILGTSKKNAVVSPIALAKYCAQRLPCNSTVVVVNSGKVAFVKDGAISASQSQPLPSPENRAHAFDGSADWCSSCCRSRVQCRCQRRRRLTRSVSSKESICTSNSTSASDPEPEPEPEVVEADTPSMKNVGKKQSSSPAKYRRSDASACARDAEAVRSYLAQRAVVSVNKPAHENKNCTSGASKPRFEKCFSVVSAVSDSAQISAKQSKKMSEKEPNTGTITALDLLKVECSSQGWPLMLREMSVEKGSPDRAVGIVRHQSVVEWALRLPNRQRNPEPEPDPAAEIITVNDPNEEDMMGEIEPELDQNERSLAEKLDAFCRGKNCRHFRYEVLEAATSNFSEENLVGKGGSSRVYRGTLPDKRSVAVKVLSSSSHVEQDTTSEVEIINSLQHRNVIVMLGYCISRRGKFLVYDFVSKGNLEENLHTKKDKPVIPWKDRLRIAVGVAKALEYLHEGNSRSVIHRDVKSSNILLFEDFEPQLSDFGLAKWADATSSHVICNDVAGTFGYLAPEYSMYGIVNEKTDVFSFGVVLLEIITGKQPIGSNIAFRNESLVTWARPFLETVQVSALADPLLEDSYPEPEMKRMIIAASLCTRRYSRLRPKMSRILKLLRGEEDDNFNWRTPNYASLPQQTRAYVEGENEVEDRHGDEEEEEPYNESCDIRNHLSLALLGVDNSNDNGNGSFDSTDDGIDLKSWKQYLQGRFSRSSSFE